jgi:hypothetical protein
MPEESHILMKSPASALTAQYAAAVRAEKKKKMDVSCVIPYSSVNTLPLHHKDQLFSLL